MLNVERRWWTTVPSSSSQSSEMELGEAFPTESSVPLFLEPGPECWAALTLWNTKAEGKIQLCSRAGLILGWSEGLSSLRSALFLM